MINVTKTYLPPLDEYVQYLEKIWESGWLTNNGVLVQELEARLAEYLGVPFIQYVANGTLALQIALEALNITGEVITTPFSYVASADSIAWQQCTPVFVDIEKESFCLDASQIEAAITEKTRAIMAVHVYGHPCDVDAIQALADKYDLKVIYDGAHAFGCRLNQTSLLNYGHISTLSFHATKLFHTVEGGAVISHTAEINDKISLLKSFGHRGDEYFTVGINAKNSEFHAAMGLCVLPRVAELIQKRRHVCEIYIAELTKMGFSFWNPPAEYTYNYAYFPVVFKDEKQLLQVKASLNAQQINPRRYFYPSLNTLPYLSANSCPVSEEISSKVLCLPLFDSLPEDDILRIVDIIRKAIL